MGIGQPLKRVPPNQPNQPIKPTNPPATSHTEYCCKIAVSPPATVLFRLRSQSLRHTMMENGTMPTTFQDNNRGEKEKNTPAQAVLSTTVLNQPSNIRPSSRTSNQKRRATGCPLFPKVLGGTKGWAHVLPPRPTSTIGTLLKQLPATGPPVATRAIPYLPPICFVAYNEKNEHRFLLLYHTFLVYTCTCDVPLVVPPSLSEVASVGIDRYKKILID